MRLSKTLATVVCRACCQSQLTGSRTAYGSTQVQRRSIRTVKWNLPIPSKKDEPDKEAKTPRVKRTFKKGEEEEPDEKEVEFARKMLDEWIEGAADTIDEFARDEEERAARQASLMSGRKKPQGDRADVQKTLTVAIVGPPNAGKSVLLNALVGEHVSAVSRKRNTTSSVILGVASLPEVNTQIVFTDTPGAVIDPREMKRVKKDVVKAAKESVLLADDLLLVVDAAKRWYTLLDMGQAVGMGASGTCEPPVIPIVVLIMVQTDEYFGCLRRMVKDALENACHVTVVLNKVDLVNPKYKLPELATRMTDMIEEEERVVLNEASKGTDDMSRDVFKRLVEKSRERPQPPVFMISASERDGTSDVLDYLITVAEEGEWLYSADQATDLTPQERLRELLKEALFDEFHQEVPYAIEHETRAWSKRPDGSYTIYHDLVVPSKTQRRILLGKSQAGHRLERLRRRVLPRLCEILKTDDVDLQLWVRASSSNRSQLQRAMGKGY